MPLRYAVLGVDFLFDRDGGAWLIETNYAPDLCDTKRGTNEVKLQLAKDMLATFIAPSVDCIEEHQHQHRHQQQRDGDDDGDGDGDGEQQQQQQQQRDRVSKAIQEAVATSAARGGAFVPCSSSSVV